MIDFFFLFLHSSLLPLGGWGVFIASVLEEVVAPIPSTIVLLGSGAVFLPNASHFFQELFFTIAIPASLGISVGSLFVYYLSWYVGEVFILKWGKFLGITKEKVEQAQKKISEGPGDELTLFFLRAVPLVPSVIISSASGLLRIPTKTFFSMTFLGTIPRASFLAIVGWKAGEAYRIHAEQISNIENVFILLAGILLIIFLLVRFLKHKRDNNPVIS